MALNKNDQDTFRDYLLGGLGGDDLEEFEKQLLTDDGVFEELLVAEDELIDQYVGGNLSSDEREVFEKHFLITAERQDELDFARTLRRFVLQKTTQRSVWWEFQRNQAWMPRAAAAVVVMSFVAVLAYLIITRAPQNIATVTLTPSANTRGETVQVTRVNLSDAAALKISLKLPEHFTPAARYRVELDGDTKTKLVNVVGQDTQSVTVQIPANQLPRGQYALKLFVINADDTEQRIPGNYLFDVE
jgi:methionine-rich copper-binding protein CopC